MKQLCFLFVFNLLLVLPLLGQDIAQYPTENCGLSITIKKPMTIDDNGFIWYATSCGLVLETGNLRKVFPFEPFKGNDIKPNGFMEILFTSGNQLWAFAIDVPAVYQFDITSKTGQWVELPSKNVIANAKEDENGKLWFTTYEQEIYRYDIDIKEFLFYTIERQDSIVENSKQFLNEEYLIRSESKDSSMLFSKNNNLLSLGKDNKFRYVEDSTKYNLESKIAYAKNGFIVNSNIDTTYYYKDRPYKIFYEPITNTHSIEFPDEIDASRSLKVRQYQLLDTVSSLYKKGYRLLTISTDRKNVNLYSLKTIDHKLVLQLDKQINFGATIFDFDSRRDELIVITEEGIKVHSFDKVIFTNYLSDIDRLIVPRVFFKDSKGQLYVQTVEGLLKQDQDTFKRLYDTSEFESERDYHIRNALDGLIQGDSIIWTAGIETKLLKTNLKNLTSTVYAADSACENRDPNPFYNNHFRNIALVSNNTLLLGGGCGLYSFDIVTEQYTIRNQFENVTINTVYDIEISSNNSVYVATDQGLYEMDNSFTSAKKIEISHPDNPNKTILPIELKLGKDKTLWIGDTENLLIKYSLTDESIKFNEGFKDQNLRIASIIETDGIVWVSTFNGLYVLDSEMLNKIRIFNEADGLPHYEFNINSAIIMNDETIYMGSMNGFTSFNAEAVQRRSLPVNVFLLENYHLNGLERTDVDLNSSKTEFKLTPERNNLNLKFSLDACYSYKLKYEFFYQIPEISNLWIGVGKLGLVQLQGLNGGSYSLNIQAIREDGLKSNQISYNLSVIDIFYKTLWFKIVVLVLLMLIVSGVFLNKQKRIKAKQQKAFEIRELRLRAAKAQMNPHFLHNTINNLQSVLINKSRKEVDRYFKQFSNLVQLTFRFSQQRKITLEDELFYLESYLLLSNLRLNMQLNHSISIDPEINHSTAYLPPLLIQPIVENAINHGLKPKKGEKKLEISIKKIGTNLVIEVLDNGVGRVAASKNNKETILKKVSLSSDILKRRLELSNFENKELTIKITDITPKVHGAFGTLVKITVYNVLI